MPCGCSLRCGSVHSAKEINRLKGYVRNAIEAQLNGEGYSMVEVLCQCPTNWGMSVEKSIQWMNDKVAPYYTLGELKGRGK